MVVTWNNNYQLAVYFRSQYFSTANDRILSSDYFAPGHLYCPVKAIPVACESINFLLFIMHYDALQLFNWLRFMSCWPIIILSSSKSRLFIVRGAKMLCSRQLKSISWLLWSNTKLRLETRWRWCWRGASYFVFILLLSDRTQNSKDDLLSNNPFTKLTAGILACVCLYLFSKAV